MCTHFYFIIPPNRWLKKKRQNKKNVKQNASFTLLRHDIRQGHNKLGRLERGNRIVLARPLLGLGALQIPERIRVHDRTRVDERDGRERQSCRRVTLASRIAGDGGVGAGVIGLCAIHLVEFDYWEKTCIIHCPGKSKRLFKCNLTRTFLVAFKCE